VFRVSFFFCDFTIFVVGVVVRGDITDI